MFALSRVNWKGGVAGLLAGLAVLPAEAQVMQRMEVIQQSEQQIHALLEKEGEGLRLDRVLFRDDLNLPDGQVHWKVVPNGEWRAGRQAVPVEIAVNGKTVTVVQVQAMLKQSFRYLVLTRPLKRGEVVTEADLKAVEGELDRPSVGMLEDARQVIGQAANKSVQANRPLQNDWFTAPHVVNRGERVQVIVSKGGLRIETSGIAKSAGKLGETIAFENPISHQKFEARVVGPGRAEALVW